MSSIELPIHSTCIADGNGFNVHLSRFKKCVYRARDTEPLHGIITLKIKKKEITLIANFILPKCF